jgi:UDP-N-acetylglucosamine:LPS N-acetylglucosamine transferase
MEKNRAAIIFLCYGEGGHEAQMASFYKQIPEDAGIHYLKLCEGKNTPKLPADYHLLPLRSKYNKCISIFLFPVAVIYDFIKIFGLVIKYCPCGLVSVGPGSGIIAGIIFKLLEKKIIYIETRSRFLTMSLTGKFFYHLASRFYVQHQSLLKLYPKAIYAGLL